MLRVGLTGGIASGKSVAAERFESLGATVIDHDTLARRAVQPGSVGLDAIVKRFGAEILSDDGSLDRAALAHIVFGDVDALTDLNAIVHPEVRRLSAELDAAVAAGVGGAQAVVVHDIPLLVETGQGDDFHIVVVVDAPVDLRLTRMVETRGLAFPEAKRRVAAQTSDQVRNAAGDVILDGSGTQAQLEAQVDELWVRLIEEAKTEAEAG